MEIDLKTIAVIVGFLGQIIAFAKMIITLTNKVDVITSEIIDIKEAIKEVKSKTQLNTDSIVENNHKLQLCQKENAKNG